MEWKLLQAGGNIPLQPYASLLRLFFQGENLYCSYSEKSMLTDSRLYVLDATQLSWSQVSLADPPCAILNVDVINDHLVVLSYSTSQCSGTCSFIESSLTSNHGSILNHHGLGYLSNALAFLLADSFSTFISSSAAVLDDKLFLCSGIAPCNFRLNDMQIQWSSGSILCSMGSFTMTGVSVTCREGSRSEPMFQIFSGGQIALINSSFSRCSCQSVACVVQLRNRSSGVVHQTSFTDITNLLGGGAVSVSASALDVSFCRFLRCQSQQVGPST
eukprot:750016-Hanusia_phi.AAC.1